MCGISGIVSFNQANQSLLPWTIAMNKTIRHRGPDDEGFVGFHDEEVSILGSDDTPSEAWNKQYPYLPVKHINEFSSPLSAALAHRRLSIINLSPAGHQPMCDREKRYWIVFNGEIYNYKELRSELKLLGYSFVSSSDTEVLLHSYLAWGSSCVSKFIGMWAFVIYDSKEKKVFASRDRIGVKPFYYFKDKNYFAFASELKALRTLPFIEHGLNEEALYDYLVLGKCEVDEKTIFNNIIELRPGENLEIDLRSLNLIKNNYYKTGFNPNWEDFSESKNEDYSLKLRSLLQDSIELHLQSDVSVGACLSGGLDSSIITALVSQRLKNFPVYTVTSKGDAEDESNWAKLIVDQFGLSWHQTNPGPDDLLKHFEELMYCQDLPCFSANAYTQFELMRLVGSSGVKVTIDGQGADELFAGYSQYYAAFLWQAFHTGHLKTIYNSIKEPSNEFANKKVALMLPFKIAGSRLLGSTLTSGTFKLARPEFSFINNDFWNTYSDRVSLLNNKIGSNLNETLFEDYHGVGLKTMLRVGDRNSMHFGIESRVPFCDDYRLEQFALNVPVNYKVRNNLGKAILRDASIQWLPSQVSFRKDKKGFSIPEKRWLMEIGDQILPYFDDALKPYIHVDKIKKDWITTLTNADSTKRLWRLLCFAVWMKVWDKDLTK